MNRILQILVLLQISVLLYAQVTSINFVAIGALTQRVSWTSNPEKIQKYTVSIRDIPARTSYVSVLLPGDQFSIIIGSGVSNQFFTAQGVAFQGLKRSQTYAYQVKGEDDIVKSLTAGYPLDVAGPPSDLTICGILDESSTPISGLATMKPAGCRRSQNPYSLRFYWEEPTHLGYNDGTPTTILGYVIQWSREDTFAIGTSSSYYTDAVSWGCEIGASWNSVGMSQHTCMGGSSNENDVCNFDFRIAEIPAGTIDRPYLSYKLDEVWDILIAHTAVDKSNLDNCDNKGILQRSEYFVRVAAITGVGVGAFTEPVKSSPVVGVSKAPINMAVSIGLYAGSGIPSIGLYAGSGIPTHFLVTWDPPIDTGDGTTHMTMLNYYLMIATDPGNNDVVVVLSVNGDEHETSVNVMEHFENDTLKTHNIFATTYYFTLIPRTVLGLGAPALSVFPPKLHVSCAPGLYLSSDLTTCLKCTAGTYNEYYGGTSKNACIPCMKNFYSTTFGANTPDTCTHCPFNGVTFTNGAFLIEQCTGVPLPDC